MKFIVGFFAFILLFSAGFWLFDKETSETVVLPPEQPALTASLTEPKPETGVVLKPGNLVYQGEVLKTEMEKPLASELVFNAKKIPLFSYQGKTVGLIPLPLDAKTGPASARIGDKEVNFEILERILPELKVSPPKPLSPKLAAQRQTERKNLTETMAISAPLIYFDSAFVQPLASMVSTAAFGEKRVAVNYLSIHNGVDLKAPNGTPVFAINSGRVLMAEKYLYEGGFAIIDHGMSIQSIYLHLSELKVKAGQLVKKGDIVGLSGGTGLSEGPHLHFEIKIDGLAIDPVRFLELWE